MQSFILALPLWVVIIAGIFAIAWGLQILILSTLGFRPALHARRITKGRTPQTTEKPGVSVIVYANNQAESLLRNIPRILANDYPDFEVIVIDDISSDETEDVLTILEQRSDHFYYSRITDGVQGISHRKLALMLGVKAAHNDIILLTQAECAVNPQWISAMVRHFTPQTDVVIGPVAYEYRTGILSRICSFDLFQRLMHLLSTTLGLRPYAGWNVNMGFRKTTFYADNNRALARHLHLHPGEDDLFVGAIAHRGNVAVECTTQGLVIDGQSPIRFHWRKDRLNRAFTANYYPLSPKLVRSTDYTSRYLYLLSGIALGVIFWGQWMVFAIVAALLVVRSLLVMLSAYYNSGALGIRRYLMAPLLLEYYTPLIDLYYHIKSKHLKKTFRVGHI